MSSFENFVRCRVVSPLAASATDIALYEAVAPFNLPPEEGGVLVLTDSPNNPSVIEVIRYEYRNALGLYGVQRGQEGTAAFSWTGPVYCYQSLMAGDFQALLALKAPLASPSFSGTPTTPTAPVGTNGPQIASTAFVQKGIADFALVAETALSGKVDKAAGQSLMTDAERTKLSGIAAGAQVNTVTSVAGKTGAVTVTKSDVGLGSVDNTSDANKPVSSPQLTALNGKVDKVTGFGLSSNDFTAALLSKLNGIATGATANATDAQLRDRTTHTGAQAISTVTGLQSALDARPTGDTLSGASPSILIVDQLRRSVEAATGGRQTVLYTAKGQPSHMYVFPRFSCEDIAPGGELGTGTHPAFLFNGAAAQEIFVGAHLASEIAGEAVSRPFVDPRTSLNFDQSRALCQANGAGWDLMSNLDWAAIALWCMANGYEPLGNTNWGRHHTKRWETARRVDTLPPGEATGTGRTLTGSGPASWAHDGAPAGIQDLVGNVWEWVSGMKMVNGRAWLAPDNGRLTESQFVDSGFTLPTTRVFSSVSATGASDLVKQSLIAPASAALAPQGYLYTDLTAERLPIRGGAWSTSSGAGLGALNLTHARAAARGNIGFRPRFRAQ